MKRRHVPTSNFFTFLEFFFITFFTAFQEDFFPIESVPSDIAVREDPLGRHVRAREDNVFVISEAILPIGQTDRLPTQSINLDIPDDATALFADKYGSSVFFTP